MALPQPENIEIKLNQTLENIERLKKTITLFMNTYKTMQPKDRAKAIQDIQKNLRELDNFIVSLRTEKRMNTAMSFKVENIKNKTSSLHNLWRRVEEKLYSA